MCTLGSCFAPYPLHMPSLSPPTFPPYRFSVWATLAWPVLTGQHLATSLPCSHTDETLVSSVLAFYLFQSCSSQCPGFSFRMVLVLPGPREVPSLFQHPSALEVGKRPHSSTKLVRTTLSPLSLVSPVISRALLVSPTS